MNDKEVFLNHLKNTIISEPSFQINDYNIYSELIKYSINNGICTRIEPINLVGIHALLKNKCKKIKGINTFDTKDFLYIENRCNNSDEEFHNIIQNSIKIYISVDSQTIKKITTMLIEFVNESNITTQIQLSSIMRNDAIIIRVKDKEDSEKIINYINKLKYQSSISPNPFLLKEGNISMTIDGKLSYNLVLSKIIANYLLDKKENIEKLSTKELSIYIEKLIEELNNKKNISLEEQYGINNEEKYKDLIIICTLIRDNLNNTLTKDKIYSISNNKTNFENKTISNEDYNVTLHIMNTLVFKYGVKNAHDRVIGYINKKYNLNIFTRDNNVRAFVEERLSPSKMKTIITNLGWNAFLESISITNDKYGYEQASYAITNFYHKQKLNGFTNDNDTRSYLGFIVPPELIKEKIVKILKEKEITITDDNIVNYLFKEIKGRN